MSEIVECTECGGTRWIILQTPSGPDMVCNKCDHRVPLEAAVNLEGINHA